LKQQAAMLCLRRCWRTRCCIIKKQQCLKPSETGRPCLKAAGRLTGRGGKRVL
jgi:hypothetical protein